MVRYCDFYPTAWTWAALGRKENAMWTRDWPSGHVCPDTTLSPLPIFKEQNCILVIFLCTYCGVIMVVGRKRLRSHQKQQRGRRGKILMWGLGRLTADHGKDFYLQSVVQAEALAGGAGGAALPRGLRNHFSTFSTSQHSNAILD